MARRILNRKELREAGDIAERQDLAAKPEAKEVKKPAPKRKSRAKANKEVRLKAFWGVFNQALNPVVLFEYSQQKEAQVKASELSESKKTPHFVQVVKKVIEE
jgi:hypothetical protein